MKTLLIASALLAALIPAGVAQAAGPSIQQAEVSAADGLANQAFGAAVAASSDTLVVAPVPDNDPSKPSARARSRTARRSTRARSAATRSRSTRSTNKVRFKGRISRRKRLKPGRYSVQITATAAAGERAVSRPLKFQIVR